MAPSLGKGGAERVLARLADHWAEDGRGVTLITIEAASADVYPLSPNVTRVSLALERLSPSPLHAVANVVQRTRALRKAIERSRPDVVVSFVDRTNVLVLFATLGMQLPILACERVDPRQHQIGPAWSALRRLVYRRAVAIVVQTDGVAEWARRLGGVRDVVVIPNGIRASRPTRRKRTDTILGVGRLAHQKGFDLLLHAFAAISSEHPEWTVIILGTGPRRAELQATAAALDIVDRVEFRGWVDDPLVEFQLAGIFALSSRYEGFPNALLEAMAAGTPTVAFDCPSGPSEIVRDGFDGILVPAGDVGAFARALHHLMVDGSARARLGAAGLDVATRFAEDRVLARWDAVVDRSAA